MKTTMPSNTLYAFTGILSLVVLGLAASAPVQAQGKTKKTKADHKMDRSSRMDSSSGTMGKGMDDESMTDPAPINYPMAAPGTIGLYHYKNYRHNTLAEGNINDVREHNMMMMDQKMLKMGNGKVRKDDETMADPAPVNYPAAAPGTTGLYHYKTYRGDKMAEGNINDVRGNKLMMMDKALPGNNTMMRDYMHRSYYDNPFLADPAPVNYPIAAPGSLGIYTYTDFTGDHMTSGSYTDRKADKEKMRDNMTPGSSKMGGKKSKKGM